MNLRRRRLAAAIAGSFFLGCAKAPGEYLVTVSSGADEKVIRDAYGRLGIKSSTRVANSVFLVVFDSDPGLASLEGLRAANPAIRAVQPNQRYKATN